MKFQYPPGPPRWADRLLETVCAPHLLEEVQGDLHERYGRDCQRLGKASADQRYVTSVLSFMRPFALKRQPSADRASFFPNPAMIRNYVTIAWRNLARNKVSALINLIGLTLGVTACLVIYVITRFELSYDTFHPDSDRIYRVVGQGKFGKDAFRPLGYIPRAAPRAIRDEVSGLETVATFHSLESAVQIPAGKGQARQFDRRNMDTERASIVVADPAYFSIFRYDWLAGNAQTALAAPYSVVLSEHKARMYFGNAPLEAMLGREVIYRDSIRTTVTGIVKDWRQNTDLPFTDFISLATIRASLLRREINLDEWNDIWSASQTFVKLANGATPDGVNAQLSQFSKNHFGPNRGTGDFFFVPHLQPLSRLHFDADYLDNYSRKAHLPTLYGLMGVAVFILLIAAINFINLATAQAVQRTREVGMRKVLGSNRWNLIAQFMSETFILTGLAVSSALVLTMPVLHYFRSFIPAGVAVSVFEPPLLLFLLAILVVTALLSGLYPAWILSAYRPAQALKGQTALAGNQRGYLRKGLIVFQFTVSLVFIVGTIMVGRQLRFIRDKDLGFSTDAVVLINTLHDEKSAVLAQKLRQLAGVRRVAMQWAAPVDQNYMLTKLTYRGKTENEVAALGKIGDADYIPLYGLRLLAGRNFVRSDTLSELVINQTFAKVLGAKQPAQMLGKLLYFGGKAYPVVGVVADFHGATIHEAIKPTFIGYMPQMATNLAVKLASRSQSLRQTGVTLAVMEKAWKAVYPDKKFDYSFLDDSIARLYEKEQKTGQLVNTATAIAILISCLGLFGLATFMAEQRTKEIGVRKVLGASVASIIALLSRDFLKLVFIAIAVSSPIAWWMMEQWLQGFAYKVGVEWWVFALAGGGAVLIALVTVSFQSIRAALVNPVKSLRSE